MKTDDGNIKGLLLDFLHFCEFQIENDKCSLDEMKSFARVVMEELKVWASIDDLSEFFGQSRSNVSNILARRIIPDGQKERTTHYNFGHFLRIMPQSWLRKQHSNNRAAMR